MKRYIMLCAAVPLGFVSAQAESISVEDVVIDKGGTVNVAISLTNSHTDLVSFQMDLYLPDGITLNKTGCSLSNRFDSSQELTIGKQSDGSYRLTSTSFSLIPISGTSGTIITLSLTASQTAMVTTATIQNILFVTSNSERIIISNMSFGVIVKDEQTLSLTSLPSQTYGNTYTLPSQTDQGLTLTWTVESSTVATISGNVLTATGVGTTTVTATQVGNNSYLPFTNTYTLTVNAKNISDLTISDIADVTYNGAEQTPAVTVIDGNNTLTNGTDYTVSYSNNINVGTATVTVTGKGNYTGTKTATFIIYDSVIIFADDNVKAICIANWDKNGDNELGMAEAAAVIDIGGVFKNMENITSFDELQYFTRLTSISWGAFSGCISLTSVSIPSSVTSIDWGAFSGCISLTSVSIPSSVTSIGQQAFYGCSSLTSITIPNSVTSIGSSAFYDCTSLTSVTIHTSVTTIGQWAFWGCSSLTSIKVESGNTVYDSRDNCNAIIETSSNTLIQGCQNTTIPNDVTSIGDGAFVNCSGLTSIDIPNNVTAIGGYAFGNCSGLTSVTIPNSVTSIGSDAFSGCSGLSSIRVASGNTVYDSRDNCNAIIKTQKNELVVGCKNTIIPNSVTSIGRYAFWGCSDLLSVAIPNSVTYISDYAFADCINLTTITIPNSVTYIGGGAFADCTSLTSVIIPNTVTQINDATFQGCSSLTSVTIPNSVTSIYMNAFRNCI